MGVENSPAWRLCIRPASDLGLPVMLIGITIGPDYLQVAASKKQVKDAPDIALRGDELEQADESALYHHYQLNYTPPDTPSGRRLARRS